ncbi:anti-sigma factor domain-containing protein [Streptomyces sp. BK239]|uniref:anti-sigma factor n=1 Tax=Streptomyces sp. BK239 TaxID=2512155 RepID=UPI00102BDEDB|nr:anti-sigma factor [Streptomyces sp. BK239]RZU11722.1 anti-sigma-K factor RskA [Streptomyces sp. BK239]
MSFLGLFRRDDPHSLAAPYALDALEPDERRRFEKHLKTCDRCTAEVRELAEDAVRLAWSAAAPPPLAMRDRVLAAVRTTPQDPAPAAVREQRLPGQLPPHVWGTQPLPPRTRAPRARRPVFAPFAAVTAVAAVAAATFFAFEANRAQDQLTAERTQARDIAHVLAAPDARTNSGKDSRGGAIAVVASASTGEAIVTLSGYGSLPTGQVHQLWVMRPHAQPRSLGLFKGDTPLVATGLDPSSASLAVTVEPDGGSPQPTTQPVVQLTLKSVGFGE